MGNTGLRSIVSKLEEEGELIRIKDFVNPELEITEITHRISKKVGGGEAIGFATMDDQTISLIDKKWNELEIGEFVQSPSLKFKNSVKGEGAIRKD